MFKLGIFKKEQLTPDHLEGFVNSRKFIALDLYNSLDGLPLAEIDKIQERMLRRFRVHNGVLKYTYAGRFDDFDRLSISLQASLCFPVDSSVDDGSPFVIRACDKQAALLQRVDDIFRRLY